MTGQDCLDPIEAEQREGLVLPMRSMRVHVPRAIRMHHGRCFGYTLNHLFCKARFRAERQLYPPLYLRCLGFGAACKQYPSPQKFPWPKLHGVSHQPPPSHQEIPTLRPQPCVGPVDRRAPWNLGQLQQLQRAEDFDQSPCKRTNSVSSNL